MTAPITPPAIPVIKGLQATIQVEPNAWCRPVYPSPTSPPITVNMRILDVLLFMSVKSPPA